MQLILCRSLFVLCVYFMPAPLCLTHIFSVYLFPLSPHTRVNVMNVFFVLKRSSAFVACCRITVLLHISAMSLVWFLSQWLPLLLLLLLLMLMLLPMLAVSLLSLRVRGDDLRRRYNFSILCCFIILRCLLIANNRMDSFPVC